MTPTGATALGEVVSTSDKVRMLKEREEKLHKLDVAVHRLYTQSHTDSMDEDYPNVGCMRFLMPTWLSNRVAMRRRHRLSESSVEIVSQSTNSQSTLDQRVFGVRGKGASTSDRLVSASNAMEKRIGELNEKVESLSVKAAELAQSGKRADALLMLKRKKGVLKQLETATATHVALESQVDMLQQASLQKEVASALSASVATTKKRTKGLLSKADDAVDGAVELKDLADDVAQALGGLQTDAYDDDELAAELDALVEERMESAPAQVALPTTAPVAAADASCSVDESESSLRNRFPAAPQKSIEAQGLLATGMQDMSL